MSPGMSNPNWRTRKAGRLDTYLRRLEMPFEPAKTLRWTGTGLKPPTPSVWAFTSSERWVRSRPDDVPTKRNAHRIRLPGSGSLLGQRPGTAVEAIDVATFETHGEAIDALGTAGIAEDYRGPVAA